MSTLISALVGALVFICVTYADPLENVDLPQSIKVCKRSEHNNSPCLLNAIKESWPAFVRGIPEIESPPLNPVKVARLEINTNKSDSMKGNFILTNLVIEGLPDMTFLSVRSQFTGNRIKLDTDVKIPKIVSNYDYNSKGSVGSVKIGGKGHSTIRLDGVTVKVILDGYVENDRWILEKIEFVDPKVNGMNVYFSDLFNGNRIQNYAALLMINSSWRSYFKRAVPVIEEFINLLSVPSLNNNYFSKLSVSKLFP